MSDRPPDFPTDWLAPGEQAWCGRCGTYRISAARAACVRCHHGDEAAARATHASLTAQLYCIAEVRRGIEAVPPLFWVRPGRPAPGGTP